RVRPELEQERRPARLALVGRDHRAGDGAVTVLEALLVEDDVGEDARALLELRVEHREEEVVLPGEVRVDGALRVAGFLGDLVERGAVEAALEEGVAGGGDELRACPLLPFRLRQPRHVYTIGIDIPMVYTLCRGDVNSGLPRLSRSRRRRS